MLTDDLPPNVTTSGDDEYIYNVFNILHNTHCKPLIDLKYERTKSRSIDKTQQENLQMLVSSCFLYHMDNKFYHCVKKREGDLDWKELSTVVETDDHTENETVRNLQYCYKQSEKAKQELNAMLADKTRRRNAYSKYITIAQQAEHPLQEYETPYTIEAKVNISNADTCSPYFTSKRLRTEANMVNHSHLSGRYSRCMIADLCATSVLECVNRNPEYHLLKCYGSKEVKKCAQRFRKQSNVFDPRKSSKMFS